MELGPLLFARTFQTSPDEESLPYSFVPSQSVKVPAGTEVQVWRTDHINQLLALAHAAAKVANDVRDRVLALGFEFTEDELVDYAVGDEPELVGLPPFPPRVVNPGPCPRCGRSDMFEVTMVDVGTEGGMYDMIPGTIRCTNPACPSNLRRYVHAHPDARHDGLTPCCGYRVAELAEGVVTTTDHLAVTCPGGKIDNRTEEVHPNG